MKIFITGVAGFLGSHLARAMLDEGHEVIGCDNLLGGEQDLVPEGTEFHVADCNDHKTMLSLMRGCEVVYHCAATAYEGLSVFSPYVVTQNVYGASVSVFSAAIAGGASRIVFCSSMARYGTNQTPFLESYTPRPQDPYGIAKFAAELTLKNLAEVHDIEFVIAVPHNIIGPHQKFDDPFRNVASIMINRMLQNQQPIIYGDGEQKRCFSFVGDCLSCLSGMLDNRKVTGEVINIGPDRPFITINELAREIASIIGFRLDPIYVDPRPQEVKHATCCADKARALLGYETKTTLRDGLNSMVSYINARGTKPFQYHLPIEIKSERTPKTWTRHLF